MNAPLTMKPKLASLTLACGLSLLSAASGWTQTNSSGADISHYATMAQQTPTVAGPGQPHEPLGGQPPAGSSPSVKNFGYEIKYHRAFEALLWSMPATSIYSLRRAFDELGLKDNNIIDLTPCARLYFAATFVPEKLSDKPANVYLNPMADKDGHPFEAGKLYRVNAPPDMPVKQFWSLTVYDRATWGFIYTDSNRTTLSSYDLPRTKKNADGSAKATNWEGGFRVPTIIRWPGVIKPGTIYNDIVAHEDLVPTFAAAGEPDLVAKVKKGYQANGKTFKVHLDGYNLIPWFKGEVEASPRNDFFY